MQAAPIRAARATVLAIVGAALATYGAAAQSQQADAGTRAIRLIVPAAASGSADKVGRVVASQLTAIIGRPVQVDNLAAGGMVAGTNAIAAAVGDGETLGLAISTAIIGGRFLVRGARFNPTEDFTWFAILGSYPNAMIIPGRDPARTLAQWLEAKRRSPRPIVVGSFGAGSAGHLAGSFLRVEQGINLVPRFIDTLADGYALLSSGEIDVLFDGVPNAADELPRSGHRAIAVTSEKPVDAFADLPAFGAVWPGVSFEVWLGIVAPKGLPDPVRSRLSAAIGVLLLEPRHAESLRAAGPAVPGPRGRCGARVRRGRDAAHRAPHLAARRDVVEVGRGARRRAVDLRSGRAAAEDLQHRARDVRRVGVRREEHVRRRDLFGLRRALHRHVVAELRDSPSACGRDPAALSGVHTGPGATALTRMPRSTRFCASVCVNALIAPFVAE